MGSSDVAGIGMGSNIHQMMTHRVTPRVMAASGSPPACHITKRAQAPVIGPRNKASARGLGYGLGIASEVNGHC